MTRYWFAHWRGQGVENTGALEAPSLQEALRLVARRGRPFAGDQLEIGMTGFPPARYECVLEDFGTPLHWRLVNARAA